MLLAGLSAPEFNRVTSVRAYGYFEHMCKCQCGDRLRVLLQLGRLFLEHCDCVLLIRLHKNDTLGRLDADSYGVGRNGWERRRYGKDLRSVRGDGSEEASPGSIVGGIARGGNAHAG